MTNILGNVLKHPDYHDHKIFGLSIDNKSLSLNIKSPDNKKLQVTFPKMLRLQVDNFLEGNIIFEIEVYTGTECPRESIKKLFQLENNIPMLEEELKKIHNTQQTLIHITTSYGCDLLALFESKIEIAVSDLQ